ncbi:uncharacterized protein VP01_2973g1 [Puccinia sorghi]|uniref:Uncharacterized protein n=1 Tax=Puccinia sorghi TaxID=27349 RepID=A0A0L6V0R9_9BASI|nr:uncharacterized protein VP01_2973g1 [Puccinia sorghi]
MSFKINQKVQGNQPLNNVPLAELNPQFHMMLDDTLNSKQDFFQAQSEPLTAIHPASTPKKGGTSSKFQKFSPLISKKKPNQICWKITQRIFLTLRSAFSHILWGIFKVSTHHGQPTLTSQALITKANVNTLKDSWADPILKNSPRFFSALKNFQQIAGTGGYNFMNFNQNYLDDMETT